MRRKGLLVVSAMATACLAVLMTVMMTPAGRPSPPTSSPTPADEWKDLGAYMAPPSQDAVEIREAFRAIMALTAIADRDDAEALTYDREGALHSARARVTADVLTPYENCTACGIMLATLAPPPERIRCASPLRCAVANTAVPRATILYDADVCRTQHVITRTPDAGRCIVANDMPTMIHLALVNRESEDGEWQVVEFITDVWAPGSDFDENLFLAALDGS